MTYIEKKKKISIRICCIELGLKCNFKCRHCYQGESQNVAITPEVINAICDNVLWIDELHFIGGEPMLYVDELRMILKIFKKRRIRVNYLGITTNMSMRSQEFADVYNEWSMYVKRPDESGLAVSIDPFHLEFITMEQIRENIKFYMEKCVFLRKGNRINVFDNTTQKAINLVGRGENLTLEDFKMCNIVTNPLTGIGKNCMIQLKEKCKGNIFFGNACGYRCVKNCTNNTTLAFRYDGSIQRAVSLPLEEAKEKGFVFGNILKDNLYESIIAFNKKCENTNENSTEQIIFFNKNAINISIRTEVVYADYLASINELDEAKEHIDEANTILYASTEVFSNTANLFNEENEATISENLKQYSKKELEDLENNWLTMGITTADGREKRRNELNELKKTLENLYFKIEEMQKHNTYGHIL